MFSQVYQAGTTSEVSSWYWFPQDDWCFWHIVLFGIANPGSTPPVDPSCFLLALDCVQSFADRMTGICVFSLLLHSTCNAVGHQAKNLHDCDYSPWAEVQNSVPLDISHYQVPLFPWPWLPSVAALQRHFWVAYLDWPWANGPPFAAKNAAAR